MGKKAPKASHKSAGSASSKAPSSQGKVGKKGRHGAAAAAAAAGGLSDSLDRQLALLGLRVKNITADGNCFFRALSDQLQGDESLHSELRSRVCAFMAERPDDFAPFVEDDQTLDTYLARMRHEGVWAGHMELQAASLVLGANIAIYQAGQPRWAISNFPAGSRMLHLSYHDGEHYNSVRRGDDYSRGTAADISENPTPVHGADQVQACWCAADEARVAEGTGCDNPLLIKQQLQAANGDVAAAIEAVIEIMAGEDWDGTPSTTAAAAVEQSTEATSTDAAAAAAAAAAGATGGDTEVQQEGPAAVATAGDPSTDTAAAAAAAAAGGLSEHSQAPPPDSSSTNTTQQQSAAQHGGDGGAPAAAPPAVQQPSSTATAGTHTASHSVGQGVGQPSGTTPTTTSSSSSRKAKGVKLKSSIASSGLGGAGPAGKQGGRPPSRNKPCPCGSGRKHKVCCGATGHAPGRSAAAGGAAEVLPAALATLHI